MLCVNPSDIRLPGLFMECRKSSGRHSACGEFLALFRPAISKIARRVAAQYRAENETEDLVQEIGLKLIAGDVTPIDTLPGDSTRFLAYMSVAATNAARDFFRSRNAAKRGRSRTIPLDDALTSILGRDCAGVDQSILLSQIEGHLPSDTKSQTLFRLYYRQGFSAKEIASIPAVGLSLKGVESLIHRITVHLRKAIASTPLGDISDGKRREIASSKEEG